MSKFSWVDTFGKLAFMAGVINQPDGPLGSEAYSWTAGLLPSQAGSLNRYHAAIGSYLVGVPRRRVIAHEKVIYFLEAMAIHYGRDVGSAPSDGDIAHLMLAANDHVTTWKDPGRPLSEVEMAVADGCQATRYNHHPDLLRRLSRAAMILRIYRLQDVTAADLRFLEEFCLNRCDKGLRPIPRETIERYTLLFDLRREYEARGGDTRAPEFDSLFDEAINNWDEDQHSAMESRSMPHLERLRAHDVGFLQDDGELAGLLHYLSFQCMRTDKMRSKSVDALPYWPGFDAARSWGLLARILATNLSHSFFMSRRNLHATLLVAGSESQFVTQPVIRPSWSALASTIMVALAERHSETRGTSPSWYPGAPHGGDHRLNEWRSFVDHDQGGVRPAR